MIDNIITNQECTDMDYPFASCRSANIWSLPTEREINESYLLSFALEGKKLAYAPSIALQGIPENVTTRFKQLIKEDPFLSVREESGTSIIKNDSCIVNESTNAESFIINHIDYKRIYSELSKARERVACSLSDNLLNRLL